MAHLFSEGFGSLYTFGTNEANAAFSPGYTQYRSYPLATCVVGSSGAQINSLYPVDYIGTDYVALRLTAGPSSAQVNTLAVNRGSSTNFRAYGADGTSSGYGGFNAKGGVAFKPTYTKNRVAFGFAVRLASRDAICSILSLSEAFDGSKAVGITSRSHFVLRGDGKIVVNGAESEHVMVLNRWHYLEIEIDRVSGNLRLYRNNSLQIETALPAALATGAFTLFLGHDPAYSTASGSTLFFADVYVAEEGTAPPRLGPITVRRLALDSEVVQEWQKNVEAKTHLDILNQVPTNPNQYAFGQNSGQEMFFKLVQSLSPDDLVLGVGLFSAMSKSDTDDRLIALSQRRNNQNQEHERSLTLNMDYYYQPLDTPLGAEEWTPAIINDTAFGAVIRP